MINAIDYSYSTYTTTQRTASNTLDKEAFLLLLITELKNQNPLDPMDNKDFIAQLTQFSTLEQITNMTESIQNFLTLQEGAFQAQAASLIGKYAVVQTDQIAVSDGTAESIVFELDEAAPVVIRIYDSNGNLVKEATSSSLDAGTHAYVWDARDSSGLTVSDGTYTYTVSKINSDGSETEIGGVEGGKIESVKFRNNQIYVYIGGKEYPLASIVEIMEEGDNT
ncbi:flagellar hook assembly protein FlgD [Thermotoga profunda]|uniref:flagellar hook assembly protein FlgD n=1 Tax=Thermotoga profunda TaxID=1508420 RepID=UPI000596F60F|nr:flagellar hook assembly protein FlgD [Thermotoga profunda]